MDIRVDKPNDPQPWRLLREHLDHVAVVSPRESIHTLDAEGLTAPDITFYTAWDCDELLGCGALKELDPTHGEIKSMRTARQHLRKGVAAAIVNHIITVARSRRYMRLSLETGVQDAFAPARALYERHGFEYCGPFADYRGDPNSVFMTLTLPLP